MHIGDGGITVSVEPTPDEAVRALFHGLKQGLTRTYTMVAGALIVAAIYCFSSGQTGAGIVVLVLAAAFPIAGVRSARVNLRKVAAHMCVPTTLRLTANGCEWRTDTFTTTMVWSAFSNIENTQKFWVCYMSGFPAEFILKRAYDAEQLAQIEGFLAPYEQAETLDERGRVSGVESSGGGSRERP
ncbi:YcxB family protein [Actinomadura sp. KC216]|uniref:YcxB family protein n=1 Tax=Actinomadura sp. KC216 TaxID=2530370 RepID=UPI00104EC0A6|nr:YcxB family protein [Actinomadura sp. KC216]TDB87867.1 YcxB family protein [Actinomadura sp. KC216]